MDVELQRQDDLIYRFFKTTTEPYDSLEWDGKNLEVVLENVTTEVYSADDLRQLIPEF